jgi:hypothetical protein
VNRPLLKTLHPDEVDVMIQRVEESVLYTSPKLRSQGAMEPCLAVLGIPLHGAARYCVA